MRLSLLLLLLPLLGLWKGCSGNRTNEAEVAVVEPLLLISTLDGLLYAIGQKSGIIRWTLRDEPLVRHSVRNNDSDEVVPESLLLSDPKDGSLYMLSRAVSPESTDKDQEALKKLPFTMKEVISVSPCRSSDGLLYMGRKVDSWLMIHSKTGEKVDVLDTESPTCRRSPDINQTIPSLFLTKSVYQLSIFDSKTRAKKWNISMVDYSSTASPAASKAPYHLMHLTSSTSGKILTIDLESDEDGPKILWTKELSSPIVAMYEIDDSGSMQTRKVPFTTIGDDSEKLTGRNIPSLYVGESSSSKQMYALSAIVSYETRLLSSKKRKLSLPLIEGPAAGIPVPSTDQSSQKPGLMDCLLLGFYEYPDVSQVDLSAVLPIGHRVQNLIESKSGEIISSTHLPPTDAQDENPDVFSLISLTLVFNISFMASALLIVLLYLKNRLSHNSEPGIRLGKISYDATAIIGRGSAGTCVYKGLFEGSTAVAVKRIVNEHCVLAQREIELLRSLQHPNVVRYYATESDQSFRYIAIELAELTLADFMQQKYDCPDSGISDLDIFRDSCKGLSHLHSVSVIHRDIKPQNILISSPVNGRRKALLSDLGVGKTLNFDQTASEFMSTRGLKGTEGWIAPEVLRSRTEKESGKEFKYSKQMDIFSMGCLAYYVFSGGCHPFGEPVERQSNIMHDRTDFSDLSDEEEVGRLSLIRCMVAHNPSERPSIDTVLLHPIFWSRSKQLQFLQDVSDRIEKETINSNLIKSLESGKWDVIRGDWTRCLPEEIHMELNRHRSYPSNSLSALLRAIRNKKHHYRELSPEAQSILGEVPDQFMQFFDTKYPRLLFHCYIAMQDLRFESMFKEYYDQDCAWDFVFPRIPATGIKYFMHNSPTKNRPRGKKSRFSRKPNRDQVSKENCTPAEIDFENMRLGPNGGMDLFSGCAGGDPLANWSCVRAPPADKQPLDSYQ